MKEFSSVSEIIGNIKHMLEGEFRTISVTGEVSNLSSSHSGHWYLTLSDQESSLSVALFKSDALRNTLIKKCKNGDQVSCIGSIGVYSKRGTFQLIAKRIMPAGLGNLKIEYEKLKLKLAGEGLFDLEHKKSIPELPQRIGVISAKKGAAIQDFLSILERRSIWYDIVFSDALVQGEKAPQTIRKSLHNLIKYSLSQPDESQKLDVILITRGGGSMEDLWAFNDEALAFDIFNCPIPIISAVGHEVDYTICDMVADLRVETPSAAAEVLTLRQFELMDSLKSTKKALDITMSELQSRLFQRLARCHPSQIIEIFYEKINRYRKRLRSSEIVGQAFDLLKIYEKSMFLDDLQRRLFIAMKKIITEYQFRNNNAGELLRVLNPENVLERGFSIISVPGGDLITSGQQFDILSNKVKLEVKFNDGERLVEKV